MIMCIVTDGYFFLWVCVLEDGVEKQVATLDLLVNQWQARRTKLMKELKKLVRISIKCQEQRQIVREFNSMFSQQLDYKDEDVKEHNKQQKEKIAKKKRRLEALSA